MPSPTPAASPASSPADWAAVKALFESALDCPPGQRQAHVQTSGAPPAVQAEVLSLLAQQTQTGTGQFLAPPLLDMAGADDPGPVLPPGTRLGAWEVTGPLGQGGMAEVVAARRADGAWEGEAAIKVIRRGLDSAAVLARFHQEQRALARLAHPHIARLLDAGRTPAGQPYFVMEKVQGQPIDQACAGLTLEQRLDLFLQLADAVAFAHRQLLIHRDLKPSNVLVDGDGQVKLLDFGIAKALDPLEGPAAEADLTQAGQRPFTPTYASPEQVKGEPVGTATDIYSLGVLLYVLLTGQRPYGRQATTPQEAVRSVLEEEPSRPSSLSPGLVNDPQWLHTRERLRGDLDNILLKALDKAPDRRYVSVDALAADLRAHLEGRPVSACEPRLGYLLGRWVRRHRLAAGALALAVLGISAGLVISLWQMRQAQLARDLAQVQLGTVKRLTGELAFRFGDAVALLPGGADTRESLLKQTLTMLEPALAAAPDDLDLLALRASVLGRLASVQGNAPLVSEHRSAEAEATVRTALALVDQIWAQRLGDWRFANWALEAMRVQAYLQRRTGQLTEAQATLQQVLARADAALAVQTDAEGQAYLRNGRGLAWLILGQIYDHTNLPSLGQPAQAERCFQAAEADFQWMLSQPALLQHMDRVNVPGDSSTEVYIRHQLGTVQGGRALIALKQDRLPEALAAVNPALDTRRGNVAREPHNVAWRDGLMTELNTQAVILVRLGQPQAALAAAEESWQLARTLAQQEGPKSKWAGVGPHLAPQYGRALALNGRHAQALEIFSVGLNFWAAQAGSDNPNASRRLAWFRIMQAESLHALGRSAQAQPLLAQALQALPPLATHPSVGRDARLTWVQGLMLATQLQPRQAAAHRAQARQLLDALAAERPLGLDQQQWRDRLGG